MAAGRFVVPPYFPARDRDYNLLAGALLYVYENETTTKTNIYTDVALTVLSSNPVVANSSGQFPAIYAEAGTEASPVLYSVSVTTSTGASPGNPFNFDNYRPSVDWETAASALAEAAAEAAQASAVAAAADLTSVESIYDDILAIEATGSDAPAIAARALRDGSNLTGSEPAEFLAVLDGVSLTALALGTGSGLVGFFQSGTNALDRTVQAKSREILSVSDFEDATGGVATNDDSVGITSAIAQATARGASVVKGVPGVTYYLNAIVTIPDNVILDFTGCTVRCTTGSTQTHFFTINGDNSGILGCAFIGTGQVAPSAAYSSGTYNGTAIYVTGGSTNVLIEKCTFTNFQSGPILCYGGSSSALAADKLIVSKCIFTNVQIYTGHQTSSVIGFYRCDNSLMVDCVCTTYNWKCFYAANSTNSGSVRCYAIGGSGNGFDASHHIVGDPGGLYTDCFHFDGVHSGAGAGAKLDRATRGILANFRSTGQFGAIIQDSKDFSLVNCKFWGVPASSTYAYAAITATTGESCYGQFIGCTAQWSGTPVVGNTGFLFGNNAASTTFGPIRVSSCRVLNPYWGVSIPDDGLAKSVFIDNTYLMDCQQYGVIAWAGDLKVTGGEIRMTSATAQSAIFVAQDGVTTTGSIIVDGVKFTGSTIRRNIEFGGGQRLAFRLMALRNCDFSAGTRPIEFSGNANAADVVSLLVIENNTGTGFTTGGLALTFNTTTATKARVRNNSFMDASFVPVADTYTNLANVIWLEDMAYAGTPEAVFYAAPGTRYKRTDGGANTSFYVKESISSSNTGWAAK